MNCNQCGKPAVCEIGNNPLCVDHALKMQEIADRQYARDASHLNYLSTEMDAIIGMPGFSPQIRVPSQPIYTGPVIFHNIKIGNSVIGVLNTGSAQTIDAAISHINQVGNPALGGELQRLTQTVIDAADLQASIKNEILDHLAFLSIQAETPKEKRQSTIGRVVLSTLERLLNTSASVVALWPVVKPLLEQLFK